MSILLVEDDALAASGIIAGMRLHAAADYAPAAKAAQSFPAQSLLRLSRFGIVAPGLRLPDEGVFRPAKAGS